MSDGLFSSVELQVAGRAGYRLDHLEVFNWGTFDQRVWRLTPGGETTLLTGDIGSGKSTLVDAVTTLLLPAHKISYNKAAGAEAKERTLRSYVEGHYKSERIESSGTSRPIGLRDHTSYSVLLGVFVNEGHGETVTVAQVFHQKDKAGQPDRFFVTSAKELSIEGEFTAFGSDLNDLRRRLRSAGAEIHTVFPEYSRHVRRLLGIRSEQSMELFHQTVSMKSVGNLNEFVRNHMLEPVDAVRAGQGHRRSFRGPDQGARRGQTGPGSTRGTAAVGRHQRQVRRRDRPADHRRTASRRRPPVLRRATDPPAVRGDRRDTRRGARPQAQQATETQQALSGRRPGARATDLPIARPPAAIASASSRPKPRQPAL